MRRCLLGLAALSTLAFAQEQPTDLSKLNGIRKTEIQNLVNRAQSALTNAQNLNFKTPQDEPRTFVLTPQILEGSGRPNTCAIPLHTIHGDPNIDPRIFLKPNSQQVQVNAPPQPHAPQQPLTPAPLQPDRMPAFKGMPVCGK